MIEIKELRGHHCLNLFIEYVKEGKLPRHYHNYGWTSINYPITITDTTDDYCRQCKKHPAINFCKNSNLKTRDVQSAEFLNIEIGNVYNYRDITHIFNKKRNEMGITKGTQFKVEDLLEHLVH